MRSIVRVFSVGVAGVGIALAGVASADHDHGRREEVVRAQLVGYNETPSVSTPAKGRFRAVIDEEAGTITYTLSYDGIGDVLQSHLHLGQHHTAGGIVVFLCTNLANVPAGTVVQPCPKAQPAEISGIIRAGDVTGNLTTQQIAPGEFAELLAAIRAGAVYVNIHSTPSPAGEIRGQIF